ncbi:F(420)H(2) dehydrogenase subunit B [uncultured archaeon]|nr:F(420)H(2) dehydrogenase subunit B [uncultured archaeon]
MDNLPNQKDTDFANAEREMSLLLAESLKTHKAKPSVAFTTFSGIAKSLAAGTVKWSRKNSLWPMQFGLSCCAMEMFDFGSPRIDAERKGYLFFRGTPRQSDVMIVAGWTTKSMAPEIRRLYGQMLRPRYVIAYGECATCGGPWWESYNIIKGIDQILPVDVYVAGCPPKPENLFAAFMKLQKKVGGEIED